MGPLWGKCFLWYSIRGGGKRPGMVFGTMFSTFVRSRVEVSSLSLVRGLRFIHMPPELSFISLFFCTLSWFNTLHPATSSHDIVQLVPPNDFSGFFRCGGFSAHFSTHSNQRLNQLPVARFSCTVWQIEGIFQPGPNVTTQFCPRPQRIPHFTSPNRNDLPLYIVIDFFGQQRYPGNQSYQS